MNEKNLLNYTFVMAKNNTTKDEYIFISNKFIDNRYVEIITMFKNGTFKKEIIKSREEYEKYVIEFCEAHAEDDVVTTFSYCF